MGGGHVVSACTKGVLLSRLNIAERRRTFMSRTRPRYLLEFKLFAGHAECDLVDQREQGRIV